jgi:hypothetical protein
MSNVRAVDGKIRVLLLSGVLSGPFFTITWLIAGLNRANYDPRRYPISSLSIGEFGWIQITNFLITGSLIIACSLALRQILQGPSGSFWGPLLIGLTGVGLMGAGLFVTDPLNGYPPGTSLLPTERTMHGILHDLFGVPVFLGLPIAGLVFGRFFDRHGDPNWSLYSRLSGIGMFAVFFVARLGFRILPTYPALAANFGILQRITLIIGFAWLTFLSIHFLHAPWTSPASQSNRNKVIV